MKLLFFATVFMFIGTLEAQTQNPNQMSSETHTEEVEECTEISKENMVTFMETIRGTSLSGTKISLEEQRQESTELTSIFLIQFQGSSPSQRVKLVSDMSRYCLTESITVLN